MTLPPSSARFLSADALAARHIAVEDLCETKAFRLAPHGTIFFETTPPVTVAEITLEAAANVVLALIRDGKHNAANVGVFQRRKAGMFSETVETSLRLTERKQRLFGRFRSLRRQYRNEGAR